MILLPTLKHEHTPKSTNMSFLHTISALRTQIKNAETKRRTKNRETETRTGIWENDRIRVGWRRIEEQEVIFFFFFYTAQPQLHHGNLIKDTCCIYIHMHECFWQGCADRWAIRETLCYETIKQQCANLFTRSEDFEQEKHIQANINCSGFLSVPLFHYVTNSFPRYRPLVAPYITVNNVLNLRWRVQLSTSVYDLIFC